MIKIILNLIKIPSRILNLIIFSYRNVSYLNFPQIEGIISVRGKGKLKFREGIIIKSSYNSNPVGVAYKTAFHISPNAEITVGNNVGISNSLFYARKSIVIEDNVLIGGGCQIYDTDFHSIDYSDRVLKGDNNVKNKPVLIQEGAFIGASSIILKGVTVGRRSIVAAGSVVSKSIPDDEIWGGNPAKFIRKI